MPRSHQSAGADRCPDRPLPALEDSGVRSTAVRARAFAQEPPGRSGGLCYIPGTSGGTGRLRQTWAQRRGERRSGYPRLWKVRGGSSRAGLGRFETLNPARGFGSGSSALPRPPAGVKFPA